MFRYLHHGVRIRGLSKFLPVMGPSFMAFQTPHLEQDRTTDLVTWFPVGIVGVEKTLRE